MKLYYISSIAPGFRWQGTQVDAKKYGGKLGFELREVPTDKPRLMAFLNAQDMAYVDPPDASVEGMVPAQPLDPLEQAELRAVEAARSTVSQVSRNWEATDIEDFILHRATVAQAENIFACLGNRFKELANGAG